MPTPRDSHEPLADSSITEVVQWILDNMGGGSSDHGSLTGLGDDDHPQYHTDARGDARYWQLTTDLATQAELDAHAGAADPHTGYQRESEKGAVNGYASLDGSGDVPDAQIPDSITRDTELEAHRTDTTDVHGIADTSALALTANHPTNATFNDHSARHENGGADEISVAGLSGELADAQPVTVRKNTGADIGTRSRLNLIEGTNITLTVADDAASDEVDITIAAAGGGGGTPLTVSENGTPVDASVTTIDFLGADFDVSESPEDEVNVAISSAIARAADVPTNATFNDHSARHEDGGADEISVAGLSGLLADAQKVTVRKNTGADVGTRKRLNLIEGSNITLTVADDAGGDEIDITIAAAGGGGGGPTKISGNSGAFGGDTTWETLTANSSDITSTTQTTVMTVTGLGAGTYRVKALLIFQTAATTTGIGITLNHTGTVSRFVSNWYHVTTGGAAATGISDQAAAVAAGQLVEGKAERVKDTRSSFTVGVDTANADELAQLEAILVVTASGDLQVKIATEVAGSAVRLMAGSTLEVHKVA